MHNQSPPPTQRPLRILAVEPYYGGSHKAFLDGLLKHSKHEYEMFTLPARKWKWRMRASAINVAQWLEQHPHKFDLIFASDFLSMADLTGISPIAAALPRVTYFHENQFTYPEQQDDNRDYQFLFTNITTCLASTAVFFNSAYHRTTFVRETGLFLKRMPDFVPEGLPAAIEEKSRVLHVGCSLEDCSPCPDRATRTGPLVILWNHRWEHDKNPETFFEVLFSLDKQGIDFRLIVVGEHYRNWPPIFDTARERLADRIIQFGYAADRQAYLDALRQADVVVSTARQEFFGIAVVEAMACGCYPLLPTRLSYPELIPQQLHNSHLYGKRRHLRERLAQLCANPSIARTTDVSAITKRFAWQELALQYDAAFREVSLARM